MNYVHSSCEPNGDQFVEPLIPDQTTIDTILSLINNARSIVTPAAASMPAITWDTRLARLAQRRSQTCQRSITCLNGCAMLVNLARSVYVRQHTYFTDGENFDWVSSINFDLNKINDFSYGEANRGFGLSKILINISFFKI